RAKQGQGAALRPLDPVSPAIRQGSLNHWMNLASSARAKLKRAARLGAGSSTSVWRQTMKRSLFPPSPPLAGANPALAVAGCAPAIPTTLPPVPTIALATPALPAGSIHLNGAGATFPLPVYSEWTYAFQFVDPSVIITYNGIGSSGGKQAIISN